MKIKHTLKFLVVGLLSVFIVVSCQSDSVRQPSNPQSVDCRIVQHVLGKACVPKVASRLVSLDNITLADAAALGVSSIGAAIYDSQETDYLKDYLANYDQMERLGNPSQPSLEKILKLKPDLIMGVKFTGEPIFSQLSQIAPTAIGEWVGFPSWREYFNFVAYVLGKEEEANKVWGQYKQRIANIKSALGNHLKDMEVSTVYARKGRIYIDTNTTFIGGILTEIGIRQPTYTGVSKNGTLPLSEEAILDIDTDILFITVYNDEDSRKSLAKWQQKPLWQKLKVVQENRVYIMAGDVWKGGNPIAANLVIDDLYRYLVEGKALESLPKS